MFRIKAFEKDDIDRVIAFEQELRKQEPDTYYWEPDATYRKLLKQSFDDERFRNMSQQCKELRLLLIASIRTTSANQ